MINMKIEDIKTTKYSDVGLPPLANTNIKYSSVKFYGIDTLDRVDILDFFEILVSREGYLIINNDDDILYDDILINIIGISGYYNGILNKYDIEFIDDIMKIITSDILKFDIYNLINIFIRELNISNKYFYNIVVALINEILKSLETVVHANNTTVKFNHITNRLQDRDYIFNRVNEYISNKCLEMYDTNIKDEINITIENRDSMTLITDEKDIKLLDNLIKIVFDNYDIEYVKKYVNNSIAGYYTIMYELINIMLWLEFEYILDENDD